MYLLLTATLLLVSSCYEREGTTGQTDLRAKSADQMLSRVMAYVQAHERQIDFLTERNFSSKDLKTKFARFQQSKDTAWLLIPIVRSLRDSMATADSLYFAPRRLFALSLITKGSAKPRLWFVEQEPTREFHKENRTDFFYRHFTGRQDTYSEAGLLVHAINIYNGWYDTQLTIKPAASQDSTYAQNYDEVVTALGEESEMGSRIYGCAYKFFAAG